MVVSRLSTAVLALCVLIAAPAGASSLKPDLGPQHGASSFSRSGDFDGDGRRDQVVLDDELATGRLTVFVHLDTKDGPRDLRVTSLDSADGAAPDIRVVPAGRYLPDCGSFISGGCEAVVTHNDSLIVGLGSGTSVLMHWNGSSFDSDFVRDDQAEMARALSAFFALNP